MASRRLATVGRSINDFKLDRLDSCHEVALGLCTTCCLTLTILMVAIPLFEMGGLAWILTWEHCANTTTMPPTPYPTQAPPPLTTQKPYVPPPPGPRPPPAPLVPAYTTVLPVAPVLPVPTTMTTTIFMPVNIVTKLDPSGPGEEQGVQLGWRLVKINGDNVVKASDEEIHEELRKAKMPVHATFEKPPDHNKVLKKSFGDGTGVMEHGDYVDITFPFKRQGDRPFAMSFGSEEEFGPNAGDIVLAWRKAARAWIQGQGLKGTKKDLMEEACDRMDIDSNNKISVFEFHSVCLLLNGTKAANNLQSKMAAKFGPEKTRCGNADKIFRMIHHNMRTGMTKMECFVGLHWLKNQLRLIGPPRVIISDLDTNNDAKLTRREFGNLGRMLSPPLTRTRMEALFALLDVDPCDDFVTEKELQFEEECADPYGCGGEEEGPTRVDVTDTELEKYKHAPAIIQGRATISLAVPSDTILPSDDELANVVGQTFTRAFSKGMGRTAATLQSVTPFHKGHALQAALDDSTRTRIVVVNFEIDEQNGGEFQGLLQKDAGIIHKLCLNELKNDWSDWLHRSEVSMWGKLTASYYKHILPDGMTLYQDFGQMPGKQTPLSTIPYHYDTVIINQK